MEKLFDGLITLIGTVAFMIIVTIAVLFVFASIKEFFKKHVIEKEKSRFYKTPTAACYCKDCIHFIEINGYGKCKGWHFTGNVVDADSWFCWQAIPKKMDLDKEQEGE